MRSHSLGRSVHEWFRAKRVSSVDLALFREGMSDYGLPVHAVDRLFRAFDADSNGTVSMNELLCGLSLLSTVCMRRRKGGRGWSARPEPR